MTIKRYIEDKKVPVQFTCGIDCLNEIIYAEVYVIGTGLVSNVNSIIPTLEEPNPAGLIKGASKGTLLTVLCDFTKVINPGSSYSLKFRTDESGIVAVLPLILFAEDGYTAENYPGQVIDPAEKTILKTNGSGNKFLADDGQYYEIAIPDVTPDDYWQDDVYYALNVAKLYSYNNVEQWYVSTVNDNLENTPRILSGENEGSVNTDFWKLVDPEEGQNVIKYVTESLYRQEFVMVLRNSKLYELASETRPFYSDDFETELENNDWILVAGGGGSGSFETDLDDTVTTTAIDVNDFSGWTVAQLKNYPGGVGGFLLDIMIPEIPAYIDVAKSVLLSGVSASPVEVGTAMSPLLTALFSQGQIKNGSGSVAGSLVGPATSYEFKDPDGVTIAHEPDDPIDNSQSGQAPVYIIGFGNNTWSVIVNHAAGITLYYDNRDTSTPDSNLAASTGAGTASDNSDTVPGRYYYFIFQGNIGASPTDSTGVRALSDKVFLNSVNEASFSRVVPAGTPEVAVFTVTGKTVSVVNPATNENIPVTSTGIVVNDANGDPVNYTKNVLDLGFSGFPVNTTFNFTIG